MRVRIAGSLLTAIIAAIGLAGAVPGQTPPAQEQQEPGLVVEVVGGRAAPIAVAVPPMATPVATATIAGETTALGREVAEVVASDLRSSGRFAPSGPGGLQPVAFPQVASPDFGYWTSSQAAALVQGFVQANEDGTLTVGCYLYDVSARRELMRQGFVVQPSAWRRAAHKCADAVFARLTGEGAYFDSRVVYVAETGPPGRRIKRIAIMDQDGSNHRFITDGRWTVLTPQISRDGRTIVYLSFENDRPRIFVHDVASGQTRPLVSVPHMTFAPRFSPDGRQVVFSMAVAGNTDIYRVSAAGGSPVRLTNAPGIDTGGSFSPDGGRIVFESDRGGSQQLYVMNVDGSDQRRISFGNGRYATPVWSPRGDFIAFTRIGGGGFRIGVMSPAGSGERILTDSWHDEGPSWAPNGRFIIFFRSTRGTGGRGALWSVDLSGANERRVATPMDGSDPAWSALIP